MTLARSILLALIGLALLAMPVMAAARDHYRFKHAYQEVDSNDYPAFVCDEDGDDCRPVPWYGSGEDEDECEHDTFAHRNASVAGHYMDRGLRSEGPT
jgi:hypothetical protein